MSIFRQTKNKLFPGRMTAEGMKTTQVAATCPCGETAPHVIARRQTADGVAVDLA
jgi:hypothetical protein